MNGNRPTEATIGVQSRGLPKWWMERVAKQFADMRAQEARIAAAEEAAFRAYEASRGMETVRDQCAVLARQHTEDCARHPQHRGDCHEASKGKTT